MTKLSIAHLAKQQKYSHYDLVFTDGRAKCDLNRTNTLAFLKNRGFYLFRTNVNKHIFIRIVTNIVKEVGKKDILDEIIAHSFEHSDSYQHEQLLGSLGKWFPDAFFLAMDEKRVEIKRDVKDSMQVYFTNCFVKVTKDKILTFPYEELKGYIWESQILQREFKVLDEPDTEFDFSKFMWNISNQDDQRLLSLSTAIGFLAHNFKNPAACPAIVLNDEVISDDPEGGTGKGLIGKALSHFCTTVKVDGKTFTFDKGFLYSRINDDSRILFFDDVKKNFDFEKLFSVITEGITTEKKGFDEQYRDFSETPKILISTNYALKGSGNSHARRRFELEIAQYYNSIRTPETEFNRMMFNDWDANDWLQFDNYIILCCQLYLKNGLVKQGLINLPEKRFETETTREFMEFITDYKLQGRIPKQQMFDDFIVKNPQYGKQLWFTRTKLQQWVKSYCSYRNLNVELNGFDTSKTIRCFIFEGDDIVQNQTAF